MGIRVKRDGGLRRLSQSLREDIYREAGQFGADAVEEIKNRTVNQSRDADGNTFKPYSRGYQRFKSLKTKVQSAGVNLTLTGDMIRSIVHEVVYQGPKVIIRIFSSSNDAAKRIQWNNETRKFFAISNSEQKKFRDKLTNLIGRIGR